MLGDNLLDFEPQGAMASIRLRLLEDKFAALDEAQKTARHPLIVHTSDREEPVLEMDYRIGGPPARGTRASHLEAKASR